MLRILYDSARPPCAERIEQFVAGKGFTSSITGSTLANPGQTFNELLAEAAAYVSVGLGVAYIVRHTFGGEPGEVYVAAVECLRREDPTKGSRFVLNPKLAVGKMPAVDNESTCPTTRRPARLSWPRKCWPPCSRRPATGVTSGGVSPGR